MRQLCTCFAVIAFATAGYGCKSGGSPASDNVLVDLGILSTPLMDGDNLVYRSAYYCWGACNGRLEWIHDRDVSAIENLLLAPGYYFPDFQDFIDCARGITPTSESELTGAPCNAPNANYQTPYPGTTVDYEFRLIHRILCNGAGWIDAIYRVAGPVDSSNRLSDSAEMTWYLGQVDYNGCLLVGDLFGDGSADRSIGFDGTYYWENHYWPNDACDGERAGRMWLQTDDGSGDPFWTDIVDYRVYWEEWLDEDDQYRLWLNGGTCLGGVVVLGSDPEHSADDRCGTGGLVFDPH